MKFFCHSSQRCSGEAQRKQILRNVQFTLLTIKKFFLFVSSLTTEVETLGERERGLKKNVWKKI